MDSLIVANKARSRQHKRAVEMKIARSVSFSSGDMVKTHQIEKGITSADEETVSAVAGKVSEEQDNATEKAGSPSLNDPMNRKRSFSSIDVEEDDPLDTHRQPFLKAARRGSFLAASNFFSSFGESGNQLTRQIDTNVMKSLFQQRRNSLLSTASAGGASLDASLDHTAAGMGSMNQMSANQRHQRRMSLLAVSNLLGDPSLLNSELSIVTPRASRRFSNVSLIEDSLNGAGANDLMTKGYPQIEQNLTIDDMLRLAGAKQPFSRRNSLASVGSIDFPYPRRNSLLSGLMGENELMSRRNSLLSVGGGLMMNDNELMSRRNSLLGNDSLIDSLAMSGLSRANQKGLPGPFSSMSSRNNAQQAMSTIGQNHTMNSSIRGPSNHNQLEALLGGAHQRPQRPQIILVADEKITEVMKDLYRSMEATKGSQRKIQDWDRKMGLKKSHSQTMRNSAKSRDSLKKVMTARKH